MTRQHISSQSFLSQFSDLEHNPIAPLLVEFQRLSLHRSWKADGKVYRKIRRKCLTQEFEHHYRRSIWKLAVWQSLYVDVQISPPSRLSLNVQRSVVNAINMPYIADWVVLFIRRYQTLLLYCRSYRRSADGDLSKTFPQDHIPELLKKYGKIFPIDQAKADDPSKCPSGISQFEQRALLVSISRIASTRLHFRTTKTMSEYGIGIWSFSIEIPSCICFWAYQR